MKAESVQFNQLALQNLGNVWRKAVFQNILAYQLKQLDEREAKKVTELARQAARRAQQETKEEQERPEDALTLVPFIEKKETSFQHIACTKYVRTEILTVIRLKNLRKTPKKSKKSART